MIKKNQIREVKDDNWNTLCRDRIFRVDEDYVYIFPFPFFKKTPFTKPLKYKKQKYLSFANYIYDYNPPSILKIIFW